MVSIKEIFKKFIDKSILSYQIGLSLGHYRKQEESVYSKIEGFCELKKNIDDLEAKLIEHRDKKK